MMRGLWLASCATLVLSAACSGGDSDDTTDPSDGWSVLTSGEPSSLLALWGSGTDDVWVVGGDDRSESELGPLVYHYDGSAWSALDAGVRGVDLWWTFGFDDGPVFFSGSNGNLLRYQDDTFEQMTTPGNGIIFGMWGATPDDVWAVGGIAGGGGGGFAWHFNGSEWADMELPQAVADAGTLFKVNGRASDDVWLVGSGGVVLHWTGSEFEIKSVTDGDNQIDDTFFALGLTADCVIAAGGSFNGSIYEDCGDGWQENSPSGDLPVWRGIDTTDSEGFLVGEFGAMMRRVDGGWVTEPTDTTSEDLHAAWLDPEGDVWAAGGKFDQPNTADGVLIHYGQPIPEVLP